MLTLRESSFRLLALPYCLKKMEVSGHVWLPLNRRYKPLGVKGGVFVDYNDYKDQAMVFSRDPITFKDVWNMAENGWCYLYDDGTELDRVYFSRLHKLLGHKHRMAGDRNG